MHLCVFAYAYACAYRHALRSSKSYNIFFVHTHTHLRLNAVSFAVAKKPRLKKHQKQSFGELNVVEDCSDGDTTDYVKNVVKALQLGNGEVLLAVAGQPKKAFSTTVCFLAFWELM